VQTDGDGGDVVEQRDARVDEGEGHGVDGGWENAWG
jgi:hypothetical protein